MYPVPFLEEMGLVPHGVLHGSPVSGTPPHRPHCEFLPGGLGDNRLPLGIQPRVWLTREGLEIKDNGDKNTAGQTVVSPLSETGVSIASAGVLGLRQGRGEEEPPGPS